VRDVPPRGGMPGGEGTAARFAHAVRVEVAAVRGSVEAVRGSVEASRTIAESLLVEHRILREHLAWWREDGVAGPRVLSGRARAF
jgi:hypothetical protein